MDNQSLKAKGAKGFIWAGINTFSYQIISMLVGILLARMLNAEDYGMMGMLQIFVTLATTIQESGLTAALVNKKELKKTDLDSVFLFNVVTSIFLYIILFFLAPYIAKFYKTPELLPLSRFVFLSFVVTSFGNVPYAILFKRIDNKKLTIATLIAAPLSGAIGVIMAFQGMTYWGLATQNVSFFLFRVCLLTFFSKWKFSGSFSWKPLQEMLGFSSKLLISRIVETINNNIMVVLLGRLFNKTDLGFYNQANKWCFMGHQVLTGTINGIAQPVLSQSMHDANHNLLSVFRKMLRLTSLISFPCMLGLAIISPEFIRITITNKWDNSIPLMQILCIGAAFIPIINLYNNLIISKGKSSLLLYNSIIQAAFNLCTIIYISKFGLYAMVIANSTINCLWLLVWHYYAWRTIRLPFSCIIKDILPFGFIAFASMFITHLVTASIDQDFTRLVCKIIIAACIYLLSMRLLGAKIYNEAKEYILNAIKERWHKKPL